MAAAAPYLLLGGCAAAAVRPAAEAQAVSPQRRCALKQRRVGTSLAVSGALVIATTALAQQPSGLAAAALGNARFAWQQQSVAGFRVYAQSGSYGARHQDSLVARLPDALAHARALLDTTAPDGLIDVFFVETREDMAALIGSRATGFAHQAARAVFLVTNPMWRAFERHEIMHVVAWHAWGAPAPNNDWLQEGLAQAADGYCGNYSNEAVLRAMTAQRGWISLSDLLTNFRRLPDLRAYLQAAAFTAHLLDTHGPQPLERLWRLGATASTVLGGRTLERLEAEWRARSFIGAQPLPAELARIDEVGCGIGRAPALRAN